MSAAESAWFQTLSQVVSSALLFVLIFGMSATVDVAHLREQAHNRVAILIGVGTQFFLMPLLGFATVKVLNEHGGEGWTGPMAISLLIVTSSPGGSFSNLWCSMFNTDLALSVAITSISTILSSGMLPVNLLLYANAAFQAGKGSVLDVVDWSSLFVSVGVVVAAVALGVVASLRISSHRFNRVANRLGSAAGLLLIAFTAVASHLSGGEENQAWGQPWSFYVGMTSPCLVGLALSTSLGIAFKLQRPEVISVGVECCYQNVVIAISASVGMYDDPIMRGEALSLALCYGMMEAVVLALYCLIAWKLGWTKAPREDNICKMIMTTYEVEDDDAKSNCEGGLRVDEETARRGESRTGDSTAHSMTFDAGVVKEGRQIEERTEKDVEALTPSQSDAPLPQDANGLRHRATSDETTATVPIVDTYSCAHGPSTVDEQS